MKHDSSAFSTRSSGMEITSFLGSAAAGATEAAAALEGLASFFGSFLALGSAFLTSFLAAGSPADDFLAEEGPERGASPHAS